MTKALAAAVLLAIFLWVPFCRSQASPCSDLFEKAQAAADPEERIRLYTEALAQWVPADGTKNKAVIHNNRGAAYVELERYEPAIRDFEKALGLQPDLVSAAAARDQAKAALEEQASKGRDKAEAADLYAKGVSLAGTHPGEALAVLEKAAHLDPSNAVIWNRLGALRYGSGDDEGAASAFSAAASSDPDAVWNDYRGMCLAKLERFEDAKEALKKALEGPPRKEADMRAKAREMLAKILEYEGHLAKAKESEEKGDFRSAVSEVEAAQRIMDTASARRKLLVLTEESRGRTKRSVKSLLSLAVVVIGLVSVVGGAVFVVHRFREAQSAAQAKAEAAASARASTEGAESAAFKPLTAAELMTAFQGQETLDKVAAEYVAAGRSREFLQSASGLTETARAGFALAFLRAGNYETPHELLKDCRLAGKEEAAFKVLHRVLGLRRAGALATEFVVYGERLSIANMLDQAGLGREAAGVLVPILDAAWKEEADSYLVAQAFDDAGLADDFPRIAGPEWHPGFYSGYAGAFLQRGKAGAGLALLRMKPRLDGEDWGLLVSLHARNNSLEKLSAEDLPEDKRVLLAEALIEDGKEPLAMAVLEKVSRGSWKAREYGCGLRCLQRQDRFEAARALYQDAQARIAADAAPELRYYWAMFCERHGALGQAKATYQELLTKTLGYKDADSRLKRIEAIPPEELTHLTTVMAMRDTRAAAEAAAAAVPDTEQPAAAMIAGRFEVLRPLGVGGMGLVYKARDRQDGRPVALKRMRRFIAQNPKHRQLLLDEAATMAELRHPGIVGFHGTVESEGSIYLVFEYVDGETLSDLLACRGAFNPRQCVRLLGQASDALGYAHSRNVAHLDVKPSNIMLDRRGEVKMMDFGLARHVGPAGHEQGRAAGTPAYMAPEQHLGRMDFACDIFSLGATAYELVTGNLPYPASSGLREAKEREAYPALPPSMPEKLKDLIVRCLKADPAARPRDMKEFRTRLEEAFTGGPKKQPVL